MLVRPSGVASVQGISSRVSCHLPIGCQVVVWTTPTSTSTPCFLSPGDGAQEEPSISHECRSPPTHLDRDIVNDLTVLEKGAV